MICPDCKGTGKNENPIYSLVSDECPTCCGNGRIFLVLEITVPIEGKIPTETESNEREANGNRADKSLGYILR